MANVLKHKFVSPKADVGDSALVRPVNWNDEHVFAGGTTDDDVLVWKASEPDKSTWKSIYTLLKKILTVKGGLIVYNGTDVVEVPPGTNGKVLAANSAVAAGVEWVQHLPTGTVVEWMTATPPSGWIICDGSNVSRTGANAALFALWGTTFGAGNGSTTFGLPDFPGKVSVAQDVGDSDFNQVGEVGGSKTAVTGAPSASDTAQGGLDGNFGTNTHTHTVSVMQPYITVYKIVKL
jgi:microcystin-dependent protein